MRTDTLIPRCSMHPAGQGELLLPPSWPQKQVWQREVWSSQQLWLVLTWAEVAKGRVSQHKSELRWLPWGHALIFLFHFCAPLFQFLVPPFLYPSCLPSTQHTSNYFFLIGFAKSVPKSVFLIPLPREVQR